MPRARKNLLGQTFGKRVVIAFIGTKKRAGDKKSSRTFWLCRCACGKEQEIDAACLLGGSSRSCEDCRLQKPDTLQREIYRRYKNDAARRSISFALGFEDFLEFTAAACFYCGAPPTNIAKTRGSGPRRTWTYSGIDRFYNETGYIVENCVTCCARCNIAKQALNGWEFIELCKLVAAFHKRYN